MIQITQPSREHLNNVDPEDVFSFMTHLMQEITTNPKGEDMRVFINRIEHFEDTRNGSPLMTNVKISFQIFNENNVEYRGVWRTYRAKDFTCSNSSLDPIVEYVDGVTHYKGYVHTRTNENQVIVKRPDGQYDYINKSMWTTLKEYVDNL